MERSTKRIGRCAVSLALLLGLGAGSGCRTEFVGDPRFPGGARGCFEKCSELNMEMATFVYVGEYSTACACKPIKTRTGLGMTSQNDEDEAGIEGAVMAASAGVVMQSRAAEAAAAASRPK